MRIHTFLLIAVLILGCVTSVNARMNDHQYQRLLNEWQRLNQEQVLNPEKIPDFLRMADLDRLSEPEWQALQSRPDGEIPTEFLQMLNRHNANQPPEKTHSYSGANSVVTANDQPLTSHQQAVLNLILDDFQVNENVGNGGCSQYYPTVAMAPNGNFWVVWQDYRNSYPDIYGQRYSNSGTKLGSNFKVNDDNGSHYQFCPVIGVDGSGNFVVAWEDSRNGNYDVYAQRYSSSGTKQGSNFKVNDDSGNYSQYDPMITVAGSGSFVVVWWDYRNGNADIYAQRYSSSNSKQGSNFKVNDDTGSNNQYRPAVASDGSGNFVVVWQDERNSSYDDIYAQRYSSSGIKLGSNFQVNDDGSTESQYDPAIGVDGSGNFVVVWHDYRNGNPDIYAQRYSSNGTKQGINFRVNDDSGSHSQYRPAIVLDGSGNFVVVWYDYRNGVNIYAQRYRSNGSKQGNNFRVNDDNGGNYPTYPAIGIDNGGNFVVVWKDERNDHAGDIYGQRYLSNGSTQGSNFNVNDDSGSSRQSTPVIAVDGSGTFVAVWVDERNGSYDDDIYAQRYNSSGAKQGSNFKVSDEIGISEQNDPTIAIDLNGNFWVVWEDERNGADDIYAQRYTSNGSKQGSNFKVNDDSGNYYQYNPVIAVDGTGNFVVVWFDSRNGSYDIYAQRYSSNGNKQGSNFKVNDDSGSLDQYYPAIGVDGSGNFIVVWQDERNGEYEYDIYCQRYSNSGSKQDSNFKVNDDSGSSDQFNPVVGVDGSGNFVVVWQDERNSYADDIYGQRYSSSGAKQGSNFQVNDDSGSNTQWYPAIALDANGNFAVVWEDYRNGNEDIYGQLFDFNGQKIDQNYFVHQVTPKGQIYPDVAFSNGQIYYTWQDGRVPGQGWDIFARVDQFTDGDSLQVVINQIDNLKFPTLDCYVTVRTQSGTAVGNLTSSHFNLWEDGTVESPLTVMAYGGGSQANIPLVMDYSGSMSSENIRDMETAARTFVNLMAVNDKGAIFKFGTIVQKKQGLTSDKSLLLQAINASYTGETNTAVYDAIWEGINEVLLVSGRKAVVTLTDGKDNRSTQTQETVTNRAKQYNIPIFTIGLGAADASVLKSIANETGGLYFYAATSSQLKTIYEAISQAIANQYQVTYTTHNPKRDGTWRTVDIKVTYQNQFGTDRSGYYAPKTSGDSLIVDNAAGGVGSTNNKISIRVANVTKIRGIQFQLKPVPKELKYVSSQTTTRTSGFTLDVTDHDTCVTCVLYHPAGNSLMPGNSSVIELFYDVSTNVQVGQQIQLKLQNVVVGDENALPLSVIKQDGIFSITGMKGDVNKDGALNVLDVVLIVDFIVGKRTPTSYQKWAADCNDDHVINVLDIILLIRWINGLPLAKTNWHEIAASQSRLTFAPILPGTHQTAIIPLQVLPASDVSGLQLKLKRANSSFKMQPPRLKTDLADFSIITHCTNDEIFIIGYSETGNYLEAGRPLVFEIPVTVPANISASGLFEVEEALLVNLSGEILPVVIQDQSAETALPTSFQLSQNYPNPFNPNTQIKYDLPEAAQVTLNIYNPQGQLIRKLVSARHEGGSYSVEWDGTNEARQPVSSGVYFYELQAGEFKEVRKMLLVR